MDKRATKRKRVVLTIEDKLKVCRLAKQNVPKFVLMNQFKIGKSTLNDILRSEEKLTQFKAEKNELGIPGAVKTCKAIRNGDFDKLDSALYIWFRQQREKGCPVTGPILMEKASEFHRLIYGESSKPFVASSGFQWRFCGRFGLRNLTLSGEKLSSDSFSAEQFINGFSVMTEGYSADQIFNCDETGLYFKMLPGHTLASVHKQPDGTKKAKDRVTINACANASGTIKLPLLFIGKAKNPRCFRKINKEALPVVCRNQKNAWINKHIFRDWFLNCFIPETKLKLRELGREEKAILFLDNCAAHPSEKELVSDDGKIIAKFLPPNVTALIQPMDQGVLESIKRVYRKSILRDLVSQSTFTIQDFLKTLDMMKVIDTVATAWDMVTPAAIRNSWKKLMPLPNDIQQNNVPQEVISNNDFVQQFSRVNITLTDDDIQNWMCCDGPGYEHMDEQGIVELISGDDEKDSNEEEDEIEDPQSSKCPITHGEAMNSMDKYLTWYRCQPQATPANVSHLIRFREFAAERRESTIKQTSILSFFSNSTDES